MARRLGWIWTEQIYDGPKILYKLRKRLNSLQCFLVAKSILLICHRVCRRWQRVAGDRYLLKDVDLTAFNIPLHAAAQDLRQDPLLAHSAISAIKRISNSRYLPQHCMQIYDNNLEV